MLRTLGVWLLLMLGLVAAPALALQSSEAFAAPWSAGVEAALPANAEPTSHGQPGAVFGPYSVSCASAGNCSAIGTYASGTGTQMFTVGETGGIWGNAAEMPGSAALNSNNVSALSVSCGSAGDCSATGFYLTSGGDQAFVASETGGTWSNVEPVPGMSTLNPGGASYGESVSCPSLGHCTAVGDYAPPTAGLEVFVVTER
jgi:hypothetical protein